MSTKERKSNIELLRILSILGVIILHYVNPSIGGGIAYTEEGSINFYILYILASIFVCAVNLFMLISGYFMSMSQKRSLWKPIELIIQVIAFSFGRYVLVSGLLKGNFTIKGAVASLVPSNYFVILYCVVFLLSPYINLIFNNLTEKQIKTFVLIVLLVFSVYPTLVDCANEVTNHQWIGLSSVGAYGSQWGYSCVNFVMMYIIGAYLRRCRSGVKEISTSKLLVLLGICTTVLVIWSRMNDKIGYFTEKTAWEYCNPVVILEAIIMFVIFSRLKIEVIKPINVLSKATFSVYLLHGIFIPHIGIEQFVSSNVFLMLGHIMTSVILIYCICWCVYFIYDKTTSPLFRKISRAIHLPVIDLDS